MKVLIIADIPAPYRVAVFKGMTAELDVTVFFNTAQNDQRHADWYIKEDKKLPFYILNCQENLEKYAKEIAEIKKYDVVICYDPWHPRSRKLQRLCMVKKIQYILNTDGALNINTQFVKKMVKSFYVKRAAACFAGCDRAVEYFKTYGAKESRVIKHPFTSLYAQQILKEPYTQEQKQKLRKELELVPGVIFLAVGQFIHRKGFDLLLEAWKKTNQTAHLYIIGGGPLRKEYERYICENGLKNVHILDFMPPAEVIRHYLAVDVFVMPTREDIWGLVINEAMACGLPIITSQNCTAGNELIENDVNGYVYDCQDTDALARYIELLAEDVQRREQFALNTLSRVKVYTYENIVDSHVEVVRRVAKN